MSSPERVCAFQKGMYEDKKTGLFSTEKELVDFSCVIGDRIDHTYYKHPCDPKICPLYQNWKYHTGS
jgi:hypothetical protein